MAGIDTAPTFPDHRPCTFLPQPRKAGTPPLLRRHVEPRATDSANQQVVVIVVPDPEPDERIAVEAAKRQVGPNDASTGWPPPS